MKAIFLCFAKVAKRFANAKVKRPTPANAFQLDFGSSQIFEGFLRICSKAHGRKGLCYHIKLDIPDSPAQSKFSYKVISAKADLTSKCHFSQIYQRSKNEFEIPENRTKKTFQTKIDVSKLNVLSNFYLDTFFKKNNQYLSQTSKAKNTK